MALVYCLRLTVSSKYLKCLFVSRYRLEPSCNYTYLSNGNHFPLGTALKAASGAYLSDALCVTDSRTVNSSVVLVDVSFLALVSTGTSLDF